MPPAARLAAAVVALSAVLGGASAAAETRGAGEVTAERALDGDALALAGGRVLRLAGILAYAVRADAVAGRFADSFQLVEGRVVKAAAAREIFYLNFDRDFRRDFTVGLDRATLRAFRRAGLDPAALEGKRIRVRGWVIWRNGPYIGATHPEQVEVIE